MDHSTFGWIVCKYWPILILLSHMPGVPDDCPAKRLIRLKSDVWWTAPVVAGTMHNSKPC